MVARNGLQTSSRSRRHSHEAARWHPHDPRAAAGVADHVWTLEEVVGMLETKESILDLNTAVAI